MKKKNMLFLVLFLLLIFTKNVSATCTDAEQAQLNKEAGRIKVNYEVIKEVDPNGSVPDYLIGTNEAKDYVSYIEKVQINILNLTENLTVEVSSDYDREIYKFGYNFVKDGVITFPSKSKDKIIKYTFTIKASDKMSCNGENQRILTLTQPRYNILSTYAVCKEIPDYYLCQKYVEFDDIDFGKFVDETDKELAKRSGTSTDSKKEEEKVWTEKIGNYFKEHKKAFIIGGVGLIIVAGGIATVVVIKRRRDVI